MSKAEKKRVVVSTPVARLLSALQSINLFEAVCWFLPADDVLQLVIGNKQLVERGKLLCKEQHHFSKRVVRFLSEQVKIPAQQFNAALVADRAVLSGSTVVQALYGERWPHSDLDIYSAYGADQLVQLRALLIQEGEPHYNDDYTCMFDLFSVKYTRGIVTADADVVPVQLIKVDKVHSHITKDFDLDFLKCSWDGKRVTIYNVPAVRERKSVFKRLSAAKSERVFQQMAKGYRKATQETYTRADFDEKQRKIRKERFEKYSLQRGFDIVPDNPEVLRTSKSSAEVDWVVLGGVPIHEFYGNLVIPVLDGLASLAPKLAEQLVTQIPIRSKWVSLQSWCNLILKIKEPGYVYHNVRKGQRRLQDSETYKVLGKVYWEK